jgi:hypothetical protein
MDFAVLDCMVLFIEVFHCIVEVLEHVSFQWRQTYFYDCSFHSHRETFLSRLTISLVGWLKLLLMISQPTSEIVSLLRKVSQ